MTDFLLPFWGQLTEFESDEYRRLQTIITPWVGWASLKKKLKDITPEPYRPSDDEFMQYELIAMKGWKLL